MVFKRRDKPPFQVRLREAFLPRGGWRRGIEYLGHRVRRLPDSPHRIALGFACGVFSSFTPFFGLHFIFAVAVARLVRGNMIAALIGTGVGNPLTFPLIAPVALALGRRILGHGASGRDYSRVSDAFAQAFAGIQEGILAMFGHGESHWHMLVPFLRDVLWPYLVGGLIPGIGAGLIAYYLTRPLVAAYQARRRQRMLERAHERVSRQKAEIDPGRLRRPGVPAHGGETSS
jgi:uncharacterized protein (DUF2062 family)